MKRCQEIGFAGLLVVFLVAGCAGIQAGSGIPRTAASLVSCPPSGCDAAWRRTQAYAATHASFRLRTVTDVVIETDGPSAEVPGKLAFGAVREAGSIRLIVGCLANLGAIGAAFVPPCERDPRYAVEAWANYVKGVNP